jgi:hypothetical protein
LHWHGLHPLRLTPTTRSIRIMLADTEINNIASCEE